MNWLALAIQLLPTIMKLAVIAEKAFDGKPDSGPEKKAMVMEGAKAIVGGISDVSTGGQKETWDQIEAPVSKIIDSAVEIAFRKEK